MEKAPSLSIQRSSMLNGINRTGKVLRSVGIDPFRLDADRIIKKVKKRASFSGRLENAENGLREMIKSINEEAQPNPFGSLAVKKLIERTLYDRYKIEQVLAQNSEIEQAEIKEPVFIIGMPRTGTTILHALMHEDPAHRSPLAWECLLPYPVPKPDTFNDNPQLNTVKKEFKQLFKLVPDFQRKHFMAADSPQECLTINNFDFNSFQISAQLYVPSYMDWFANRADRLATMRFHKRFLQYLQSGGVKAERWLLKTPVHLMRLDELFEVYPDARIVMTHRQPTNVVTSTASLISSVRSLYSDHEDPVRTGYEQLEMWSLYFERFLESRKRLDKEDRFINLKFEDFIDDQVATVRKIYERFNWPLSNSTLVRFENFIARNPRDKNGLHFYQMKDFGLDKEMVDTKFKHYNEFLKQL